MEYHGWHGFRWSSERYVATWASDRMQFNGPTPPPFENWLVFTNRKGRPLPAVGYFTPNIIYGDFRVTDSRGDDWALPRCFGEHELRVYATFPQTAGVDGEVLRRTDWVPLECLPREKRDPLLARLKRPYLLDPDLPELQWHEFLSEWAPPAMTPIMELRQRGGARAISELTRLLRALHHVQTQARAGRVRLGRSEPVSVAGMVRQDLRGPVPLLSEIVQTELPYSHSDIEDKVRKLVHRLERIVSRTSVDIIDDCVVLGFTEHHLAELFEVAEPLYSACVPIIEGFGPRPSLEP